MPLSLAKLLKRKPRPARSRGDVRVERGSEAGNAWRRFRRATDRYRLLTDVLGALLIVGLVVGGYVTVAGGVWPPAIVVESGSMMHAVQETHYGRIGTIDVGDIVFVRSVNGPQDVHTWADGGPLHYGRPGDVIVYAPNGNRSATPIIHRAIAFIEVVPDPGGGYDLDGRVAHEYLLHWTDGQVLRWDKKGIYFPPLGMDETWGFSQNNGYRPEFSGFITKGDNAFSNPAPDEVMHSISPPGPPITRIVDPAWVIGKAYGELPWIGLGSLALQSSQTNPEVPGWNRVGNAFAPLELWTMFFLTVAVILFVPLTIDTIRAFRRLKREQETERRLEEENRKRIAKQKAERAAAQQAQPKKVTTFAAVVSARPANARSPRSSENAERRGGS